MTRREAVLTGARDLRRRARGPDRRSPARSSSRSPRTRPTTSASPATSSRAAAWSSDALWSYQTPPLEFPRPAFEVWLPLPTFLAAIPMALLGRRRSRRRQWSSIIVGAIVPVLAWRLAADVAAERGLSRERSLTLAIGTGLTLRGLPAAAPPLRPARLDDAVHASSPWRPAC